MARGDTCTRHSKVKLRFLPYLGREPYRMPYGGGAEECFDTVAAAKVRLRELARERRIEDAAIVEAVGSHGSRVAVEWWDRRIPKKRRRSHP